MIRRVTLALMAAVALPASAVDIRPGLWEVSAQTKLPGNLPPAVSAGLAEQLSKLVPQQIAAKLEQKGIHLQGGNAGNANAKVCITPDQAKRGELPQVPGGRCQVSNFKKSADMVSWQVSCQDGNRSVQGNGQAMLLTAQNYVGSSSMTLTDARLGSVSTTTDLSGRWLAAACQ